MQAQLTTKRLMKQKDSNFQRQKSIMRKREN